MANISEETILLLSNSIIAPAPAPRPQPAQNQAPTADDTCSKSEAKIAVVLCMISVLFMSGGAYTIALQHAPVTGAGLECLGVATGFFPVLNRCNFFDGQETQSPQRPSRMN